MGMFMRSPYDEARQRTIFQMQGADYWLDNETQLIAALSEFGLQNPPPNLGAWIQQIKAANNGRGPNNTLAGFGGMQAETFLDAAKRALRPNGAFDRGIRLHTTGQIVEDGYYFERDGSSDHGTGFLEVETTTVMTLPNGVEKERVSYRWRVRVDNNGFRVTPKMLTGPSAPGNVFPGGPIPINAATAQGFEYKLWASGADIVVESVERKVGNSGWQLLPSSNPLYDTNAESCIDMMFSVYPPETLPADAAPPFYCLGRCASPMIVNTS